MGVKFTDGGWTRIRLLLSVQAFGLCWLQGHANLNTSANLTSSNPLNLPTIHIGVLADELDGGTVFVDFIRPYLNVPGRALLPDYFVEIDEISFGRNRGYEAPHAFVEAMRPDAKGYLGIAGPLVPPEVLDTVSLAAAARVVQVHQSDDPALSDLSLYPYNFRTLRSMEAITRGYFYIIASNGWTKMLSVWSTPGELDSAARSANATDVANFGFLIGATWEYGGEVHMEIEQAIRAERMRNIGIYSHEDAKVYDLMCYLTKAQIGGMQMYSTGSLSPGWWLMALPGAQSSCTPEEMSAAVFGYIGIGHVPVAPGVSILGTASVPPIPNDQSQENLTCTPGLSPFDFFNSPQHLVAAIASGVPADASLLTYMLKSAPIYDAICAIMVGLHTALYGAGVTLQRLLNREKQAFETLTDSVRSGAFQGAQGTFAFYPGTGNPVDIYHVMGQYVLPWKPIDDISPVGVLIFPFGPQASPVISMAPNVSLHWRDGSTGLSPKPHLDLYPDCAQQNAVLVIDKCVECTPGKYFDALLTKCRVCDEGTFQNSSGRSSCEVAQSGFFVVDPANPASAAPCLRGHMCPEAGMVAPVQCAVGQFASDPQSSACELCPMGRFQDTTGQSVCSECGGVLPGSTTETVRSTSSQQCICPEGALLRMNELACTSCPEGMFCPLGSNMSTDPNGNKYPRLLQDYMSRTDDPLQVFKCLPGACPGGKPGTCSPFHDASAAACGECETDAYESQGECFECGGFAVLPLLAAVAAGISAAIALTLAVNRNIHNTPAASMTVVALAGLLFTALQTIGVFEQMPIEWVEPLKSILNSLILLSFDIKMLKVACVMGNGHIMSFATRQAVAPLSIPLIFLTLVLKKHCSKTRTRISVELTNAVGTVFNLFFISIVISALNPLICYDHPGSTGSSVHAAPSILCFDDDDHTGLMLIGIVAMAIVPLPFLCLCAYGIWRYPSAIADADSAKFVHAMRFLFIRFVPQRYFFGIIILLRSLLLCLVPVVLRGEAALQILAISAVLYLYTLIREACHPWRGSLCNILDGTLHALLGLMLTCAALFMDEAVDSELIGGLATAVFIVILAVVGIGLGVALYYRFVPQKFDFFICHHKAHAAAQARLLKLMLEKKKTVTVFIDSDNLRELDKLFDIVKSQLRHLVVYLTSETLRRPWCAGEVVTAVRKKITITPVRCSSFEPPTAEEKEHPETYLDMSACNLHEYNITLVDVVSAIEVLLDMSFMELDDVLPGQKRFDHLSNMLLGRLKQPTLERDGSKVKLPLGGLMISCRPDHDEAIACGTIILLQISARILSVSDKGTCFTPDFSLDPMNVLGVLKQARAVLVVLAPGTMTCPSQVCVMAELMREQDNVRASRAPTAMVSVSTPGFEYPGTKYYEEVLPSLQGLPEIYEDTIVKDVRQFFKSISVFLPSHGSQAAIDTAVDAIFERAKMGFQGGIIGSTQSLKNSSSAVNRDSTRTSDSASKPPSNKAKTSLYDGASTVATTPPEPLWEDYV